MIAGRPTRTEVTDLFGLKLVGRETGHLKKECWRAPQCYRTETSRSVENRRRGDFPRAVVGPGGPGGAVV